MQLYDVPLKSRVIIKTDRGDEEFIFTRLLKTYADMESPDKTRFVALNGWQPVRKREDGRYELTEMLHEEQEIEEEEYDEEEE